MTIWTLNTSYTELAFKKQTETQEATLQWPSLSEKVNKYTNMAKQLQIFVSFFHWVLNVVRTARVIWRLSQTKGGWRPKEYTKTEPLTCRRLTGQLPELFFRMDSNSQRWGLMIASHKPQQLDHGDPPQKKIIVSDG